MSHYDVDYSKIQDPVEKDAKAIQDIVDYLGKEMTAELLKEAAKCTTADHVQTMNWTFGFAGITGLPFHAAMRCSCREAYKLWCRSDQGGHPIEVDELGYWIKEGKQ
jgi:hypothetical protein